MPGTVLSRSHTLTHLIIHNNPTGCVIWLLFQFLGEESKAHRNQVLTYTSSGLWRLTLRQAWVIQRPAFIVCECTCVCYSSNGHACAYKWYPSVWICSLTVNTTSEMSISYLHVFIIIETSLRNSNLLSVVWTALLP